MDLVSAGSEDMSQRTGERGPSGVIAGDMSPRTARSRGRALALGAALVACEASRPAEPAAPAPAPASAAPSAAAAPEAAPAPAAAHPLLAWLDPDSTSAVYTRAAAELDVVALAELFAVPPRAARMLRDLRTFEDGLATLIGEQGPKPSTWLRPEALAYLPPLARGPYLVRGLSRPRAEVEELLRAAGLAHATIEGMAVYAPLPTTDADADAAPADALPGHLAPAAAFPWRIVFLADDVIGCLSLKEVGGGRSTAPAAHCARITSAVAQRPSTVSCPSAAASPASSAPRSARKKRAS